MEKIIEYYKRKPDSFMDHVLCTWCLIKKERKKSFKDKRGEL